MGLTQEPLMAVLAAILELPDEALALCDKDVLRLQRTCEAIAVEAFRGIQDEANVNMANDGRRCVADARPASQRTKLPSRSTLSTKIPPRHSRGARALCGEERSLRSVRQKGTDQRARVLGDSIAKLHLRRMLNNQEGDS